MVLHLKSTEKDLENIVMNLCESLRPVSVTGVVRNDKVLFVIMKSMVDL